MALVAETLVEEWFNLKYPEELHSIEDCGVEVKT